MKSFQWMVSLVMAIGLVAALTPSSEAQIGAQIEARVAARVAAVTPAYRTSTLIGMPVKNAAGEDLGRIEELVIDSAGHVRYAAVSFGGVLGFGKKLFAIPYRALTLTTSPGSQDYYAELNIDRKLLEKAPGFSSDQWPNFGDSSFTKEVDGFYLEVGPSIIKVQGR
jgi:sporulation protein YlmC with PRC-barrel domain